MYSVQDRHLSEKRRRIKRNKKESIRCAKKKKKN